MKVISIDPHRKGKARINSFNDPFGVATLMSEVNNNIIHFRMETSLGGPILIIYYY